jgi:hypothetical protein
MLRRCSSRHEWSSAYLPHDPFQLHEALVGKRLRSRVNALPLIASPAESLDDPVCLCESCAPGCYRTVRSLTAVIGITLEERLSSQASHAYEACGAGNIDELATAIESAEDLDEGREMEATGAALYWQSWAGRSEAVPHFAPRDRREDRLRRLHILRFLHILIPMRNQGSPHQGSPHQGSPHQGSPHQGSPHHNFPPSARPC